MNFDNTSFPSAAHIQTFDSFRRNIFYLKADIPLQDNKLQQTIATKNDLDTEKISEIFQSFFHKIPHLIIPIVSLTTLHTLFKVTIDNKNYFIKINACNEVYQEVSFFQEKWITEQLQNLNVTFTPIIFVDVSRKKYPFDFMIMEEAAGEMLHNQKFSEQQEEIIFLALGKYLAQVHSIKTEKYGQLAMKEMIKKNTGCGLNIFWKEYLYLNFSEHLNLCVQTKAIQETTKNEIKNVFLQIENLLDTIQPVLLHNDLAGYNIFFKDGKITSLIDWEDAISGDPIYDIANFGTFNYRVEHKKRIDYFLKGYEEIYPVPKDFEKKYWLYYLRISIMKTALRSRYGQIDQSGRIIQSLNRLKSLL